MLPPLSTLLMAAGIALLSTLVMSRVKRAGLFGRQASLLIGSAAVLLLAAGLVLHFRTPPAAPPRGLPRAGPVAKMSAPAGAWSFSFEPGAVRWGQEVRFHVTPRIDQVDIYLNGTPLPSKPIGKGVFAVTIPAISKSGYPVLESGGTKVRAGQELIVSPN